MEISDMAYPHIAIRPILTAAAASTADSQHASHQFHAWKHIRL
jgi:hypothetical protein